ncbi:hypothetical protein [Helicobacter labetoulli]|nr:hypothetical protein [Helicobacter labetoulli]
MNAYVFEYASGYFSSLWVLALVLVGFEILSLISLLPCLFGIVYLMNLIL